MKETQKGLLSYMEKRRGGREIEVIRRGRGGIRRRERNLASNLFPMCSPHLEHPERFTELHREEKREEGNRGDQEEKGGFKRREPDLASNQFPKCSPRLGTPKEIHRFKQRREEGGRR